MVTFVQKIDFHRTAGGPGSNGAGGGGAPHGGPQYPDNGGGVAPNLTGFPGAHPGLHNLPGTPTPDPGFPDEQVGSYILYEEYFSGTFANLRQTGKH